VDEDIINLLNLKENDAVMEIDETVYLDDGTPCGSILPSLTRGFSPATEFEPLIKRALPA
jgi:hypothetical protein